MARAARKTGMALVWHIAGLAWAHPGDRAPARRRDRRGRRGAGRRLRHLQRRRPQPERRQRRRRRPTRWAAPGAVAGRPRRPVAGPGLRLRGADRSSSSASAAPPPPSPPPAAATCACAPWSAPSACWRWPARSPGPRRPPPGRWPRAWAASGATPCCPASPACSPTPTCRSPSRSPRRCSLAARPGRPRLRHRPAPRRAARRSATGWPRALTPKPQAAAAASRSAPPASPPRDRGEGIPDAALDARAGRRAVDARRRPEGQAAQAAAQGKPAASSARTSRPSTSSSPAASRCPSWPCWPSPSRAPAQFDEGALRQNARLLESVLAEFGVARPDRPDPPRPGGHPLRAGARRRREVGPRRGALRRHRPLDERRRLPRLGGAGPQRHRHRAAQRQQRETVYLRDLLASAEYEQGEPDPAHGAGRDHRRRALHRRPGAMPHLLIAGTTGSGKSVGVNAMILSILYRLPPDQCRFIMIDPKMLELSRLRRHPAPAGARSSPTRRRPSSR